MKPAEQSPSTQKPEKGSPKMPVFDFSQKDGESPAPVPKGIYEVEIHTSDFKETRAGGERLVLGVDIMSGPFAGRRIFSSINSAGYSDGALAFGRKQLAKILKALSIPKISGTEELHDQRLMATIGIEYSDEYGDKNSVDGWHPFDAEISRAAAAAPAASSAPAAPLKEQARRSFMNSDTPTKPAEPDRRTTAQIVDEDIPF
jgi:hypothetical protein